MKHMFAPVTSRELNQRSGQIMKQSREHLKIIPVTYGSDPTPSVYIVPNDIESVQELLSVMNSQAEQQSDQRSARERIMALTRPMSGKPAATLEKMREEENH